MHMLKAALHAHPYLLDGMKNSMAGHEYQGLHEMLMKALKTIDAQIQSIK